MKVGKLANFIERRNDEYMKKSLINIQMNGTGLACLFLIFMVLKLCHIIDWSWWWVTAPLWCGFAVIGAVLVFFCAIGLVLTFASFFGE